MAEKTYSQMRKEFYEAYRTKIVPVVRKFEKERKIRLFVACLVAVLLFIACFLFLYSHFFVTQFNGESVKLYITTLTQLIGFTFLGSLLIWTWIKKSFENKIKRQILPFVTSCYENLKWFEGEYHANKFFTMSNLIKPYDRIEYDDVFNGSHNSVNFDIVETKTIEIERDSDGKTHETTLFDGVIIRFDMNKNFTGNTVIREKQVLDIGNGVKDKTLKQTKLEDVEFNKKYKVFTNDEVEARYLLTPTFMEKLKNVQVAFSADRVDCAFYDKYLLIALHTKKDLFSICSLIKPVDDAKQYFTMYEEIVSIIKLIDHFKLDQKIGL